MTWLYNEKNRNTLINSANLVAVYAQDRAPYEKIISFEFAANNGNDDENLTCWHFDDKVERDKVFGHIIGELECKEV
jgi:uncharacterized protein YbaA (DUF1428 family)